jgi:hypothetical protein
VRAAKRSCAHGDMRRGSARQDENFTILAKFPLEDLAARA